MSARIRNIVVAIALLASVTAAPAQDSRPAELSENHVLLHAGRVLAVPGQRVLERRTLIIRDAEIVAVERGWLGAADAGLDPEASVEIVDLREHFVLPGLMDAHVHLSRATGAFQQQGFNLTARPDTNADATVNAIIAARLNLAAGFTTVRDVGSDEESVFAVRDAIERGHVLGPRILASGPSISVTAGHGDDAASADPDERARAGVCDGADECRTLVRHLHKIGADLIKYKSTGGFSSNTGLKQHMFPEEMDAIVAAAHQRGMKVTTHAYDAEGIKDAIHAGVDSIEHGYLLDDEALRMMKDAGVYLVPTITIARPPSIAFRFIPEDQALSSVRMRDEYAAFERAYELGVMIAFGTDTGIYPHGRNADEFATMVDKGMSTMDAIRSATVHTAELFGLADSIGTLESGKRADIVALRGDPLTDVTRLTDVDFVMKDGRIAKRDGQVTLPLRYDLEHEY